jgi:hypothetical protein
MSQSIRVPAMQVPRITFLYCFLAVLLRARNVPPMP